MSRDALEQRMPRVDVLGVDVSAINLEQALDVIDDWVTAGVRQYVCVTGVHGVMESRRDPLLQDIHNRAGLVTPDGMPLVWWSKWAGWRHTSRVYGPDLMLACCERSIVAGYRHFFYGGTEGVADLLSRKLSKRFPGLSVAGTYTPPFRRPTKQEDADIVRRVNEAGADIVWVGLSTPKQEYWMAEHRDRIDAPVLIGVGAAFDLHAGLKRQAPVWMQQSGLEWAFRLASEPRRLWKRYLRNNPEFVWLAVQHVWRARNGTVAANVKDFRPAAHASTVRPRGTAA